MEPLQYLDFELKIEREEDHYTARVLRSPAGEASCDFTLPFSGDRLELLVMKLGRPRGSTRSIHSAEMEAACELGGKLFEVVFGGDVRACLRSSLDEVYRKERTGLRLKLRLQEVPLLSDLPWEFLLDATLDRFFAQSNQTPIVRYIEMPERIKPITVNLPLHLLVMISSPSDYLRLDVERERSRLEETLEPLIEAGKVRVKWLENPTLTCLLRCLREGEYHVFHFIGHGGFDKKREEGVLVLEDEQGRGWLADAHRIGTLLHDHPSLRLAVLNSCEGARNSLTDPFAGVATGLIRQGVPAVVAMQFEITDEAAITFAGGFYAALAQGFPVDAAVAEARKAIYIQPNDIEWGTPVLYMRSSDGVLFDLTQKPEPVQKPAAEATLSPEPEPSVSPKPDTAPKTQKPVAEETPPPAHKPAAAPPEPGTALETQQPELAVVTPSRMQITSTVRILKGHNAPVNSVAFSPDGTMIASGSGGLWYRDNMVRLWRVSNGEILRMLEGHTKMVSSVAFSPDGTILASGSYDKTVRLWRVSNGELLRTLKRHSIDWAKVGIMVNSVAFSPDGTILASGSNVNQVRLWRVSNGEILRTLKCHWLESCTDAHSATTSVAFSPDGTTLASGLGDHKVQLWRVSNGEILRTLKVRTGWVKRVIGWTTVSATFSPDGTILASGSGDHKVRLWRVSDGVLLRMLDGHTKAVSSVAFSPDGTILASGSDDKTVRLWGMM